MVKCILFIFIFIIQSINVYAQKDSINIYNDLIKNYNKKSKKNTDIKIKAFKATDTLIRIKYFGYIDDQNILHNIHIKAAQKFRFQTNCDSIVLYIETSKFSYRTNKVNCSFIKDGGTIAFGLISNYEKLKKEFDNDEKFQIELLNKNEFYYYILKSEDIHEIFKKGAFKESPRLIFSLLKPHNYGIGSLFCTFNFYD